MRALRLALAFLAIIASPQLAPPAGAASSSAFTVSCGTVNAGDDVPCTVTRASGGRGLYVLFATSDGTARAGTDYAAVRQLLYFKASAITQTVAVHTAVNRNATGTLTFTASIAVGNVPSSTTGSIIEPAPVPAPTPAPQWVSAPLVSGGYARCKSVCHGFAAPYPPIIASQGDVMMYAWVGVSAGMGGLDQRQIGGFWPRDQYKVAGVGVEGFSDEWEGVVAAVPAPISVGSLAMREGLIYRVLGSQPAPWLTGGGTIYAVQYVSDTTGHYYLADDPVIKAEIDYFMGTDLQPVP